MVGINIQKRINGFFDLPDLVQRIIVNVIRKIQGVLDVIIGTHSLHGW